MRQMSPSIEACAARIRRLEKQIAVDAEANYYCIDTMDRPLSWCNVGTFVWIVGEKRALHSWSFADMLVGIPNSFPPGRQWLAAIRREDRRRFFSDLRYRLQVYESPVDGTYSFNTAKGANRRFFVRTVLVRRPAVSLLGTVIDIANTDLARTICSSNKAGGTPCSASTQSA
jgi:hypothetical protein